MVQSVMTCDSNAYNFNLMKQEWEVIEIGVTSAFDKDAIVLELKVDLASSMALQAETDLLLSEHHTWPMISNHLKILSYTITAGWYKLEISQEGTVVKGKFNLAMTEEREYYRLLTNIEISFLWYQDGYSDNPAESG